MYIYLVPKKAVLIYVDTYLNLIPDFKSMNHILFKLSILYYILYSVVERDIDPN